VSDATTVKQLDATGLICPLPVLRARKAMRDVTAGGLLEVRATDPAAVKDFAAFCEATGHALVESREEAGGVYVFLMKKAAG
jgi:tRNA 2-thiouridine synthesizing protein A